MRGARPVLGGLGGPFRFPPFRSRFPHAHDQEHPARLDATEAARDCVTSPVQPPVDEPLTADALSAAFATDTDLTAVVDATLGVAPKRPQPRNVGGPVSSLWERIKGVAKHTAEAVGRGALQAVDESSKAATDALRYSPIGAAMTVATGAARGGDFMRSWEQSAVESAHEPIGQERIDRWLGPKQGGAYDLVTGITQFTMGMLMAGKALPLEGKLAGLTKGAVVDANVFDPHHGRLSDLIQGTALANPVTRLLANGENDTELTGRIKNVLEGAMIGSAIDGFIGGLKALRAAKSGDHAAAAKLMREAERASATPAAHDVAHVVPTADGHFEVPSGLARGDRRSWGILGATSGILRYAQVRRSG